MSLSAMNLGPLAGVEEKVLEVLMDPNYPDMAGPSVYCWGSDEYRMPILEISIISDKAVLSRVKQVLPAYAGTGADILVWIQKLLVEVEKNQHLVLFCLKRATY